MTTAVEAQGLVKRYGDTVVVKDMTFTIPYGDCVALLGPNGAGKTTTIKMLCNLVRPSEGQAFIDGTPVTNRKALRKLGAVLEGARNVYWRLSAWDNLVYFANLKGLRADNTVRKRMEKLLQELELWERCHDEVRTFSRGMQQKVAIACSLVHDPDIVLLDEPTLGLDVQAYKTIMYFVRNLVERGKTVLITSHDFDFIQDVARRVIVMKQRKAFDGTTQQLAAKHGGTTRIEVRGFKPALDPIFAGWTERHDLETGITSLTGSGDVYAVLRALDAMDCELLTVEEVGLTAEIFLDLLGDMS